MEVNEIGVMSLEAPGSLFIFVLAIKLYKIKIKTHSDSSCCGNEFEIETENIGAKSSPMDGVLNEV